MEDGMGWEASLVAEGGRLGWVRDPDLTLFRRKLWVVWAERRGRTEVVRAREVPGGRPLELSPRPLPQHTPTLASSEDGVVFAWPRWRQGKWELTARELKDGSLGSTEVLDRVDLIYRPKAASCGGEVWMAWCRGEGGRFQVRVFGPQGSFTVSEGMMAFRPSVSCRDGEVWVAFEAYEDGKYEIFVRRWTGAWGPLERASFGPGWHMFPWIALDREGRPWVAYVRRVDAQKEGVLDQLHTVAVARRGEEEWEDMGDVVNLFYGVLPADDVWAVWGFYGRKRGPFLVPDGEDMWLLWERKDVDTEGTKRAGGVLLGRKWRDGWGPEIVLHEGARRYTPGPAVDGKVAVAAMPGRGDEGFDVWAGWLELSQGSPSPPTDRSWTGWRPTDVRKFVRNPEHRHRVKVGAETYTLFWGDPHRHGSLLGETEGEPDELLHFAKDRALLDFVAVTDNDSFGIDQLEAQYVLLQSFNRAFYEEGRFVPLDGYEWSCHHSGEAPNHRTVLFLGEGLLLRWTEVGNLGSLLKDFEDLPVLLHAHHPTWELARDPREANIEVCSGWTVPMRHPQRVHMVLDSGMEVGFVGGSDNHRRNPGVGGALTGVYARELSKEGIWEALRAHRTVATTGARVIVEFWVGDAFIGGRTEGKSARVRFKVLALEPLAWVGIVRNGEVIWEVGAEGRELEGEFVDSPPPGQSYYYLSVKLRVPVRDFPSNVATALGGEVWTSPIWFVR
ncbi:MAG TPA: DUF3604 domain-containing protein [Candidatus Latescibacteria bacterium]|nr:DUF3604 domain-containing protein [Candidatus Latescibacterota bacterium]